MGLFDVVLTNAGKNKIPVIKEVRQLTNLGLKDAKDLIDGAPNTVLENVSSQHAENAKELLEAAGASVTIIKAVSGETVSKSAENQLLEQSPKWSGLKEGIITVFGLARWALFVLIFWNIIGSNVWGHFFDNESNEVATEASTTITTSVEPEALGPYNIYPSDWVTFSSECAVKFEDLIIGINSNLSVEASDDWMYKYYEEWLEIEARYTNNEDLESCVREYPDFFDPVSIRLQGQDPTSVGFLPALLWPISACAEAAEIFISGRADIISMGNCNVTIDFFLQAADAFNERLETYSEYYANL